jgi:hypothetical protein
MRFKNKKSIACLWIFFVSYAATGCVNNAAKDGDRGTGMPKKSIEIVLRENTEKLMAIPGVVGTGEGLCNNKPCIKVFVIKKTSELQKKIPRALDGYPVELEETGEIRALPRK